MQVDPSAAKAQLQNYAQYVDKLFDQDSYHLYLTINMLVYEIDYFKVKESDGGLIWRYDAALTLAALLEGALEKYGYREAWDRNILGALNAADVQLSRIIINIHDIFGNEFNLKSAQIQLVDGDCELAAVHGFDEYYPKSRSSLERFIGFFGHVF
ncbi:uncharacterized protein J4E87_003218 [Alternaria ethzedia]|uniref:uncharacterized protein n=1 Tax=Alternaria ethzedia TaxID=181014 RepID=UPI0020C4BD3D|nr:uncharacterized protein J4E87_003218 [Alternaria ethzedia]KAI4630027.1 hypothetical protein J4E87_003218 [Alternaria ethzedia]